MICRVTFDEMTAIRAGYFVKKVVLGKCPKQGEPVLIMVESGGDVEPGKIWLKERLGDAVPKPFRVIIGRAFP